MDNDLERRWLLNHSTYRAIVLAVKNGRLEEPFRSKDVKKACPELSHRTCNNFLSKHRINNPSDTTELFERIEHGLFKCVRPFLYEF